MATDDTRYAPGTGTGGYPHDCLHKGTTNMTSWYVIGVQSNLTSFAAYSTTANKLVAVSAAGMIERGTIEKIRINASGVAGTPKARIGLYACLGSGSKYPGTKLYDSGEITLVSGTNEVSPAYEVNEADGDIWFAFLCDTTAVSLSGLSASACNQIPVGHDGSFSGARAFVKADQTYGALPSTFSTTTIVLTDATGPAFMARF